MAGRQSPRACQGLGPSSQLAQTAVRSLPAARDLLTACPELAHLELRAELELPAAMQIPPSICLRTRCARTKQAVWKDTACVLLSC